MQTFRVRVENLRLKPNVPAGMDLGVVGGLCKRMRTTAEDWDPALVVPLNDGVWRILDGRHRFFAAVISGRPDLLCYEDPIH